MTKLTELAEGLQYLHRIYLQAHKNPTHITTLTLVTTTNTSEKTLMPDSKEELQCLSDLDRLHIDVREGNIKHDGKTLMPDSPLMRKKKGLLFLTNSHHFGEKQNRPCIYTHISHPFLQTNGGILLSFLSNQTPQSK